MKGDAGTTLMSVLREGFQIEQTRVHHRIYVCDPAKVCAGGRLVCFVVGRGGTGTAGG